MPFKLGSPPRMRGKGCYMQELSGETGITPACAGKSWALLGWGRGVPDHPRVCGEKNSGSKLAFRTMGSPPRMRGKVDIAHFAQQFVGITPAYAGKSLWWPPAGGRAQDHPRVCGEKFSSVSDASSVKGSPPRMRGKATGCSIAEHQLRITPAYAGKSGVWYYNLARKRDHPRVCGEKWQSLPRALPAPGSPPRMRGKAAGPEGQPHGTGITPAYAGKRLVVCGNTNSV